MRLPRLVRASLVTAVAAGATIVACGGGGGGGGNPPTPDAKVYMDAKVYLDAPPQGSGVTGLGQACTPPAQGSGQGDCPAGFTCLNLQNGSHAWCSKPCATGAGDMCAMGYTGPGVASCIESIMFNGGAAMDYCGITCAGDVNGCTAQTCTGVCPSPLMCTATLMSGGSAVGSACQ